MQNEGQGKMTHSTKSAALGLLFGRDNVKITDVKFFVGSGNPSVEAMWGEINSALEQEKNGTAVISSNFDDPAKLQSGNEFLASL